MWRVSQLPRGCTSDSWLLKRRSNTKKMRVGESQWEGMEAVNTAKAEVTVKLDFQTWWRFGWHHFILWKEKPQVKAVCKYLTHGWCSERDQVPSLSHLCPISVCTSDEVQSTCSLNCPSMSSCSFSRTVLGSGCPMGIMVGTTSWPHRAWCSPKI